MGTETINILASITAGTCLSMGTISFYLGWRQRNNSYLMFGAMAIFLFLFILMPPYGFIAKEVTPYPIEIILKRVFIYLYYGFFPWFIYWYTGRQTKMIVPTLLSIYVFACYWFMAFAPEGINVKLLVTPPLAAFAVIQIVGFYSAFKQYKHNEKRKAVWFGVALSSFSILFILNTGRLMEIGFITNLIDSTAFFSIHLHSLFFIGLLGTQIVDEVITKNKLEQALSDQDRRWQSFMNHAPLVVLELNEKGNIVYINDYGVKLLGYQNSSELQRLNWCDNFLSEPDAKTCRERFEQIIREKKVFPYNKNTIRNKKGEEHLVNWTSFLTYSEDGKTFSLMNVGTDITQSETANKLINQLKLELEKEKIIFPEHELGLLDEEIIGTSDAIRYAIEKAKQVAATTAPVLLEGETGVGKELIADLIHKYSLRSKAPIVKVNCGALPKELIEDELFGHEKGAFTSAIQARKGRFELADGGTIFLDELGELPIDMQPKLLRVLQNGEFERVGGQKTIKVDVRIIAATNRDLAHEVQHGNFRDDLFYRLNVFPITIPPLRKRKEDLPLLINHFIAFKAKKYEKQIDQISKADLNRLMEYPWPGNVRELKNMIERSIISSEGHTLRLDWFLDKAEEVANADTLEDVERQHIIKVMETCHWKINGENGAAEKLNMHPNTLRSKMKKLGVSRPVKDAM